MHSLPSRSESRPTPEFLAWTLEQACALRDIEGWNEPDHVERQLRPLREVALARLEGRIFDGVALEPHGVERLRSGGPPPLGFLVDETLQTYGGEAMIAEQCAACPANALAQSRPGMWAGCYGLLYFEGTADRRDTAIESAIHSLQIAAPLAREFLVTSPRWPGFWAVSPLTVGQLSVLRSLLAHAAVHEAGAVGVDELGTAVEAAIARRLALHVSFTPAGIVQGRDWHLPTHCRRCKTPRPAGDPCCRVCGQAGGVAPAQRRKARGFRPFQPLTRILGSAGLERLRERCAESNERIAINIPPIWREKKPPSY